MNFHRVPVERLRLDELYSKPGHPIFDAPTAHYDGPTDPTLERTIVTDRWFAIVKKDGKLCVQKNFRVGNEWTYDRDMPRAFAEQIIIFCKLEGWL